jgi:hypothetical protein
MLLSRNSFVSLKMDRERMSSLGKGRQSIVLSYLNVAHHPSSCIFPSPAVILPDFDAYAQSTLMMVSD